MDFCFRLTVVGHGRLQPFTVEDAWNERAKMDKDHRWKIVRFPPNDPGLQHICVPDPVCEPRNRILNGNLSESQVLNWLDRRPTLTPSLVATLFTKEGKRLYFASSLVIIKWNDKQSERTCCIVLLSHALNECLVTRFPIQKDAQQDPPPPGGSCSQQHQLRQHLRTASQ